MMQPRELANSICDTLQGAGFQAFLVGGCVRDLLLGREPADYDVATSATPDQVLQLFPDGVAVGAQFGVILVPRDGLKVEVATFRSDIGYSDGRHPDRVEYAKSPEEDVQRRDFTINGLAMRHDTGEVLDFVDGQADLRAGIIRAIGEPGRRFAEDKLRMLRAVRFAARFGYEIEHRNIRRDSQACERNQAGFGGKNSRRADQTVDRRRGKKRIRAAGLVLAAADGVPGNRGDERSKAAAAVSSGRRCVDSYVTDAGGISRGLRRDIGVGRAVA